MNQTEELQEVCVAVLPPGNHSRAMWWVELFGQRRVPVTRDDAIFTILPDGRETLCYFVDFTSCDWLLPRVREANERRRGSKNYEAVNGMLEQGIYPLQADGITVVRGPRRLWG